MASVRKWSSMKVWWDPIREIARSGRHPAVRRGGKRMIVYYKSMLRAVAETIARAWISLQELPDDFKRILLRGSGDEEIEFHFWRAGKMTKIIRPFEGVVPNLQRLYEESESEFTRNRLKAFMSPQPCDACNGRRLKPEVLAVTFGGAEASSQFKVQSSTFEFPVRHGFDSASRITPRASRSQSGSFDHGRLRALDRRSG